MRNSNTIAEDIPADSTARVANARIPLKGHKGDLLQQQSTEPVKVQMQLEIIRPMEIQMHQEVLLQQETIEQVKMHLAITDPIGMEMLLEITGPVEILIHPEAVDRVGIHLLELKSG